MSFNEANIRDIAALANVSVMSVSRALRGLPGLGAATRERILRAAESVGYRPDPLVSSLMARRARRLHQKSISTLAFFVPSISVFKEAYGYGVYYSGAIDRAQMAGHDVDLIALDEAREAPKGINAMLQARGIQGVILTAMSPRDALSDMDWSLFATAALGPIGLPPRVHRACTDHFQGVMQAVDRLKELGYRRIGFYLHADLDSWTGHRWTAAYQNYQSTLDPRERMDPFICQSKDERELVRWIKAEKPEVVISDHIEALQWLSRLVPRKEVGFVHLDWIPKFVGVAGIDQCSRQVSAAAVDLIIEQFLRNERGLPEHPKVVLVESQWVPGATVRQVSDTA